MEISINGKPADIILEKEKTVGEILLGLENWLQGTGNRLSGITIDGDRINAARLAQALEYEINNIKNIDISISGWDELAMQALLELKETCHQYNNSSFEEHARIKKHWEESAAAVFLGAEIRELYELAVLCFSGEGISANSLLLVADERMRELDDPVKELEASENSVCEIARRMEELPLDVQTGKDNKAAETIRLFSQMGEKLFRLLKVLNLRKPDFDSVEIDGTGVKQFLNDFNTVLGELSEAYKNQDVVLTGDLAEYEMAPRLVRFFSALKEFSSQEAQA